VYKVHSLVDENDKEGVKVADIRVNKADGTITVDDARLAPDEENGHPGILRGKTAHDSGKS